MANNLHSGPPRKCHRALYRLRIGTNSYRLQILECCLLPAREMPATLYEIQIDTNLRKRKNTNAVCCRRALYEIRIGTNLRNMKITKDRRLLTVDCSWRHASCFFRTANYTLFSAKYAIPSQLSISALLNSPYFWIQHDLH
jgi:hypothetical protein